MSPRWHEVGNAGLYFYASEPHQRPHVDVLGPDWDVKLDLLTLAVLDSSGKVPHGTLKAVRALLAAERDLAVRAFELTAAHAFPGTLTQMKEEQR